MRRRTGEEVEERKAKFLTILEKHKGLITPAATEMRIGRGKVYQWIHEDEEFKKSVDEIADTVLDFVEENLYKNIEKGDTTAAIFYLKNKGRKRGYSDGSSKQEDNETINLNVQIERNNNKL